MTTNLTIRELNFAVARRTRAERHCPKLKHVLKTASVFFELLKGHISLWSMEMALQGDGRPVFDREKRGTQVFWGYFAGCFLGLPAHV